MKDWTDAEISRRLALAIGWKDVLPGEPDGCWVVDHIAQQDKWFDYRNPAVIWPIGEHFDCFPYKSASVSWISYVPSTAGCIRDIIVANTAAKAVALAVIKAKEKQDTMIPLETIKTPLQGVF